MYLRNGCTYTPNPAAKGGTRCLLIVTTSSSIAITAHHGVKETYSDTIEAYFNTSLMAEGSPHPFAHVLLQSI